MYKFYLECLEDYTIVLPETYLEDQNKNRLCVVPAKEIKHSKGQRVGFKTKKELGEFIRHPTNVGKWTIAT